ncbi:GNAT family N-acetyltransferase [Priestia taiwanensis]|uniref:N-acetyltransferase n=1 Tax=Priestia taiwanensis TaxID=1347902 RepID=A0A917EPU9_9BACI|nr:GNAT family N-acetyltransferase [Priestia taiwanensis]MBM7362650.1 RimJ/RimL family protein N-acetyltransferase [Priestia taiwanensis]GGE63950.1 N-acetyltransferase [Priestia taiwanensis]
MITVKLVPHNILYAERMSQLTSAPEVKDALGLSDEQVSLEGTKGFIDFILKQEEESKQYSRMMLNEENKLIGVITLKELDHIAKTSHIGTWIGHEFWGRGYNELAKEEILHIGFTELGLDYVFAGAKLVNVRSQKAQEKLAYIKLDIAAEFPLEHMKLEEQTGAACILNVIEKTTFLDWYENRGRG